MKEEVYDLTAEEVKLRALIEKQKQFDAEENRICNKLNLDAKKHIIETGTDYVFEISSNQISWTQQQIKNDWLFKVFPNWRRYRDVFQIKRESIHNAFVHLLSQGFKIHVYNSYHNGWDGYEVSCSLQDFLTKEEYCYFDTPFEITISTE